MANDVVNKMKVRNKLKAFKKIVNSCTKLIAQNFSWFDFKINPTISSNGEVQKVTLNREGGTPVLNIDFNTTDVLTKNGAELASEVNSRLYNAALEYKKNLQESEKKDDKALADNKVPDLEGKSLLHKDEKPDVTKEKAREEIANYVEKFLKKRHKRGRRRSKKHSFSTFTYDALAKVISDDIMARVDVQKLEGEGWTPKQIVETFFDLSTLESNSEDALRKARLLRITNKVDQLSMTPGKELVALGYAQQYEALKSDELSEQFRDLKINDIGAVKRYCETIANRIMSKAGLNNIKITYNEEGALGQYVDSGYGNHTLNINLSRIKSISELTMTITHELTHATDSAVNQVNAKLGVGAINEKDGTGLINNIQESIAGSGMSTGSEGYNFLLRLKKYCYHANPNERHARQNELSSLMFMVESLGDDPDTKKEVSTSIKSYINYQNKTIDMCRPEKITSLESEFNRLKEKGALTDKAVSMIEERLEYLKQLQQGGFFDVSADQEAMQEADKLYTKLTGKSLVSKVANQNAVEAVQKEEANKASASTKELN